MIFDTARLREAADRLDPTLAEGYTSLDLALVREAAYRIADGSYTPAPSDPKEEQNND